MMPFACMTGRVRRGAPALASALLALVLSAAAFQVGADEALEDRLKAAFIYHFTQFIEWPELRDSESFSVCVLGDSATFASLDAIAGKSTQGRTLTVTHFRKERDLDSCQVVFLRPPDPGGDKTQLRAFAAHHILTVSDSAGFTAAGGIVQFFLEENHVRFAINTDAAGRAGLVISSKLLRLAKVVRDGEQVGE